MKAFKHDPVEYNELSVRTPITHIGEGRTLIIILLHPTTLISATSPPPWQSFRPTMDFSATDTLMRRHIILPCTLPWSSRK